MNLYYGVVENRNDPLKLGRCQARIVGLHTHDKSLLPTADLPWATPMQPVTSAAMNGIGWSPTGPVEGTTVIIFFADEEQQQPIMMGTLGGIPQSKDAEIAAEESGSIITDGGVLTSTDGEPVKSSDGTPVTLGNRVESEINKITTNVDQGIKDIKSKAIAAISSLFGFGSSSSQTDEQLVLPVTGADNDTKPTIVPQKEDKPDITAQPLPGKADPSVLKTPIVVKPMPKYVKRGEEGKAEQCIGALINACDTVGLKSKYAKASILAIVGGESAWVPREEGHIYNKPESLLSIFPSIFKGDINLASQYSNGKKSKQEFFEFVYGNKFPKGQGLGNKTAGDGGKYYGRGFNQLTGKSGYEQAQEKLKSYGKQVDLLNNPSILNEDIEIAALSCAIFYKENVKHPQDDPGYFVAARARTGADAGGGYAKKQIMYEYFLGQGVLTDSTVRPDVEDKKGKIYTKEEVAYLPVEKQKALLEDRSDFATTGFKDPNGKYPLRNLVNEPDTNRLARGIIQDTAISYKDQIRTVGIPGVFGSTWEQPLAPFGGRYPYNKVYETESGHIQMFDDTSGHETVSLYHRKGSFLDIDANGTQVNKIVGDGYTIYDRNGFIYIAGKCNLTVGNSVNIMVVGDANIEVNGKTEAIFHSQVDIGAAKDVNMSVRGDFNLNIAKDFNINVGGSKTTTVTGNNKDQVTGNITSKAGGYIAHETAGEYTVLAAEAMKVSASEQHIKASGNVNVDGAEFHGQEGSAEDADTVATITNTKATKLVPPNIAEFKADSFEVLQTPVRPAQPVDFKISLNELDDFYANPDKYYDPAAAAGGVNATRPPQPDVGDKAKSQPPSGADTTDIEAFLTTQLAKAKEGFWAETGMVKGNPSNVNILQIWKDIGLGGIGVSDQVPWCMAFVNWTLKQCGYRYAQTARAFDMRDKPQLWGATRISGEPQPGDIIVWSYSHVNFVWKYENGKVYPVGGNQGGGKVSDNNPKGGSVTQSYPNGVNPSHSNIVGIYRPTRV